MVCLFYIFWFIKFQNFICDPGGPEVQDDFSLAGREIGFYSQAPAAASWASTRREPPPAPRSPPSPPSSCRSGSAHFKSYDPMRLHFNSSDPI